MNQSTATASVPGKTVNDHKGMITVSIMLATIMQALDGTIANVALPNMQGSLSAAQDQISWVLTSYIVAAAIATPLCGWLCDRFSRKTVFLYSVAGFTIASVLCGVSSSLTEIVFARLLQGLFGAALVPLSQAVLLDINPPEQHGSAMAAWGVGVMVGPILGPTLGGWLTDYWNWRWVFFINVPVGAMAFYGIQRYIKHEPAQRSMHFDVFGFAMLSLAIAGLQMFLDRGEQNDWFESSETWIEMIVMLVSFALFVAHTCFTPAKRSFVNYHLLQNRNYLFGLLFIFIVAMVLFAVRALLPTMLQNLMGYTAASAGLVTAPSGLGTMLAMMMVGRMVGKVDLRILLISGFGLTAISLWQMCNYTLVLAQSDIVWPSIIQGFGLGLVFVPLSAATFSTLTPDMRAQGTAMYSLIRNIGSSVGIAMMQAMLVRNTQIAHSSLVTQINPTALNDATGGQLINLHTTSGLALLNEEVTRQAAMIGYLDDYKLMLILTVLVIPLLLIVSPPKKNVPVEVDHAAME